MNNKIGNVVLWFAVLNSIFMVFRLYYFFFTGHSLSPLSADNELVVTFGFGIITFIAYLSGYALKGKL